MRKTMLVLAGSAVVLIFSCARLVPQESIGQGYFYGQAPLEKQIDGILSDIYAVRDSVNHRDIQVIDLGQKNRSLLNQIDSLFTGGSRPLLVTFKESWRVFIGSPQKYGVRCDLLSISFITYQAPPVQTLNPFSF